MVRSNIMADKNIIAIRADEETKAKFKAIPASNTLATAQTNVIIATDWVYILSVAPKKYVNTLFKRCMPSP